MAFENNYTLGRGELYFDQFPPGTKTGVGELYFGDTISGTATANVTNLDHYDNDHGLKVMDASVMLQADYSIALVCDNISPENLALFFLGSASAYTRPSASGQTSTVKALRGRYIQLGVDADNPQGIIGVTNIAVTKGAAGSVASVAVGTPGTGYTTAPSVTFSAAPGGGTTTTGHATVSGGAVTAVVID